MHLTKTCIRFLSRLSKAHASPDSAYVSSRNHASIAEYVEPGRCFWGVIHTSSLHTPRTSRVHSISTLIILHEVCSEFPWNCTYLHNNYSNNHFSHFLSSYWLILCEISNFTKLWSRQTISPPLHFVIIHLFFHSESALYLFQDHFFVNNIEHIWSDCTVSLWKISTKPFQD